MGDVPEIKPKESRLHRLVTLDLEQQLSETIDKFKSGLEIWWDVVPDTMQIPIPDPSTGQVVGMSQPQAVLKVIMVTRGILLGPQNNVNTTLVIDPIPNMPTIERTVIQGIETLNKARASQMNGPSSALRKKPQ